MAGTLPNHAVESGNKGNSKTSGRTGYRRIGAKKITRQKVCGE